VECLLAGNPGKGPDALVREAVRANVRGSANHPRYGSELLERLTEREGFLVLGAEHSLETGMVDVSERMPEARAQA
jgi:carbonic anhydrase